MARTLFAPDLWLSGRVVGPHRLVVEGRRWVAVEPATGPGPGDLVLPAGLAVPGLVDLHVHIGSGSGPFAVAAGLPVAGGVTTACSQGDAGAATFAAWRRSVAGAPGRPLLALDVGPRGEAGGDGALAELGPGDEERGVATATAHPDLVRMVAVNLGTRTLGDGDPAATLAAAVRVAGAAGLPLLVGLAAPAEMALGDQLDALRAGDVVTYCYRARPWCLFPGGRPLASVRAARARGVLFDVGHGAASFDPDVARAALRAGFAPDTVSSDLQVATATLRPPLLLPAVLGRVVRAGLPADAALVAATSAPARVLGLADGTGTVAVGGRADLAVLVRDGPVWTARPAVVDGVVALR